MKTVDNNLLSQVAADKLGPQETTINHLRAYLADRSAEYNLEESGENPVFRLKTCPIKGRECDDRSYIIVFPDGGIHAGCHADHCAGKTWADFQAAWGAELKLKKPKKEKVDPTG